MDITVSQVNVIGTEKFPCFSIPSISLLLAQARHARSLFVNILRIRSCRQQQEPTTFPLHHTVIKLTAKRSRLTTDEGN